MTDTSKKSDAMKAIMDILDKLGDEDEALTVLFALWELYECESRKP